MYIGPDGRVCPCMSMTVQEQDDAFPSVFEQPLREILGYTPFMLSLSQGTCPLDSYKEP